MPSAGGVQAGKAFVTVSAQDQYSQALNKLEKKLESIGQAASELGRKTATLGLGLAGGILAATQAFGSMGDSLYLASQRTGVTVETLSALGFAAGKAGLSAEDLGTAFKRMGKVIGEAAAGSDEAIATLQSLGLSVGDLIKLTPDQQLKKMADAIAGIGNQAKRTTAEVAIFGRSGTALAPLFANGAKGIDDYIAAAQKLGIVVSTDAAKGAHEFEDQLGSLIAVAKAAAFQLGGALAPNIQHIAQELTGGVSAVVGWIKANRETIAVYGEEAVKVAAYAVAIGGTVFAIGKIISIAGAAVGVVKSVSNAVNAVTSLSKAASAASALTAANPIVLAVVGIGALAAAAFALNEYDKTVAAAKNAKLEIEVTGALKAAEDAKAARGEVKFLIEQLQELQGKGKLEPDDAATAQAAIAALTKRYGDLGITIDATTGKLVGFGAAQDKINAAERAKEIAEQQKILDAAETARQKAATDYKEQVNEHEAYGDQGGSKYNPLTYIPKLSSHTQANADVEEIDKQAKIAAEAKRKIAELQKANSDPFADATPTAPKPGAGADDDVEASKQHLKDLADAREKLNKLEQEQSDAGMSEKDKAIAEVNRRYQEQIDLLAKLMKEAKTNGSINDQIKLKDESAKAYGQQQADIGKINEEQAEKDKKIADDKQAFELGLQEELAEKTGDLAKAALLKKQAAQAAFEKQLDEQFKNDPQGRSRAEAVYQQIQNTPQINSKSAGVFDTIGAGQTLQVGGTQDRIAKATELTAKNTTDLKNKSGPKFG